MLKGLIFNAYMIGTRCFLSPVEGGCSLSVWINHIYKIIFLIVPPASEGRFSQVFIC